MAQSTANRQLIAKIPFFQGLSDSAMAELLALLKVSQYEAGQKVVGIGEAGTDFYVIQDGELEMLDREDNGQQFVLAVLGSGQFFGELSLLDGGPRTATARARTSATLLCLAQDDFNRYLLGHAEAGRHMLTVLAQRQRKMIDELRTIRNANQVIDQRQSPWQRAADWVSRLIASPIFLVLTLVGITVWVMVNEHEGEHAFDQYPFNLLSLLVGVLALWMTIFLLASQSRQSERDRIRADLDYQVNIKAHLEVMHLQQKVDKLELSLRGKTVA